MRFGFVRQFLVGHCGITKMTHEALSVNLVTNQLTYQTVLIKVIAFFKLTFFKPDDIQAYFMTQLPCHTQ